MGNTSDCCCSNKPATLDDVNTDRSTTNTKGGPTPGGPKRKNTRQRRDSLSSTSGGSRSEQYTQDDEEGTEYDNSETNALSEISISKAVNNYKEAVEKGQETLVMYFVDEHETLDLLDTIWQNGDNSLHVAVQNKSYKLIKYLLEKGLSVKYTKGDICVYNYILYI